MAQGMEYFLANNDAYNSLTDEQIIALANGESVDIGDTEAKAEESEEAPELAVNEPEQEIDEPEQEILAKDGKHTIPFKVLEDERARAEQLAQTVAEQQQLLDELAQAKKEDAGTGSTEAQQAVLAEYTGEFPEVADDMKPYIQAMIDAGVNAKFAEIEAKLMPFQQAQQDRDVSAHFNAIREEHQDFDTLVKGNQLFDWVKTQPSFMQPAINQVLKEGTAEQVIELLNTFKAAKNIQPMPSKDELRNKADAVISKAGNKTPKSLSEVPSGTIATNDEMAAEMAMSPLSFMDKLMKMSPDQILKHTARVA